MDLIKGKVDRPQKVVIYGPEGIGKSTFVSKFPNPVFIDTEGSTAHLDVTRTPTPSSWQMLLEQVRYFKSHPDICETLIIDTADWAEQLCVNDVCAKAQKSGIEDFGYSKGYVYLTEEFGRLLNALEDLIELGMHVVFTAHAKMRKFEQPDELGSYDRWEMKVTKNTAPLLREWADLVLFANYETYVIKSDNKMEKGKAQGGKRVMHTTHHPCWDAKNRHNLASKLDFDYTAIGHCIKSFKPATAATPHPDPETRNPDTAPDPSPETPNTAPEQSSQQSFIEKSADAPPTPPPAEPPAATGGSPGPASSQIADKEDWEGIPKALEDLMRRNFVFPADIRAICAHKGYVTIDTPISKYDPEFIKAKLIGAWPRVLASIEETYGPIPITWNTEEPA